MTLPIDLVFLRHGQSEGNLAKRRSEAGDHEAFTTAFLRRHTSSYRLTKLGREQAKLAGAWLRKEFPSGFDSHIVSEYTRAMETAALLDLPRAQWLCEFYLTERDWGDLDTCPEHERQERFGAALERREIEPFFWRPPNGESFANLCLRSDRVLDKFHREYSDKSVIVPCHGEVMWAYRVRLERMSQERFKELHLSKAPEDRIYNCQIIHYTRRDPSTGKLNRYANWMRMIRPTETPVWNSGWQEIKRPRYSNDDLLRVVTNTPAMIS